MRTHHLEGLRALTWEDVVINNHSSFMPKSSNAIVQFLLFFGCALLFAFQGILSEYFCKPPLHSVIIHVRTDT